MTVGIIGLGLIGGSAAKAYAAAGWRVFGADIVPETEDLAIADGAVTAPLRAENYGECHLLLLCVCPGAAIRWLTDNAASLPRTAFVMDFCGVKRDVCHTGFALAKKYGFAFVGGHPMAGTNRAGYVAARANLYAGASLITVPPRFDDPALLARVKELTSPIGFARYTYCTAETHDAMIAYTSQLAHIVSGAYATSPAAPLHRGYSAGSYRDMTRVATLDPAMWTELFLRNRAPLLKELDRLIGVLTDYRSALDAEDGDALYGLLDEGRTKKAAAEQPGKPDAAVAEEARVWIS